MRSRRRPRSIAARATVLYTDAITAKEAEDEAARTHRRRADHRDPESKPRAARARPRPGAAGRRRGQGRSRRAARARQRRAPHPRGRTQARGRAPGRAAEGIQQRRARAPGQRAQLPEVPRPRGRDEARRSRARKTTSPPSSASSPSCRRDRCVRPEPAARRSPTPPATRRSTSWPRWWPWSRADGTACSPTPRFENALGLSRRALRAARCSTGSSTPQPLRDTLLAVQPQRVRHRPFRGAAAARAGAATASRCRCT